MRFQDYGLVLNKDSVTYRDWDSSVRDYTEVYINPITKLWCPIAEIADDYTLRHLFNFVAQEAELWELVIGEWVVPLIKDMDKDYGTDPDRDEEIGMKYLVYEKSFEIAPTEEGKELICISSFHGWGTLELRPGYELKSHEEPRIVESAYGVCLSPIPHLLDYPLRISLEAPLLLNYEAITNLQVQPPKLVELVREIFWELTFNGLPEERNKFSDGLLSQVKKINEDIENDTIETNGNFTSFNLDELMGDEDLLPEPIDNTDFINKLKDAFN